MKKTLITFFLLATAVTALAQIPVTPIKVLTEAELKKTPIDDSNNFLANQVYGYMNQELFLPHRAEALRSHGWQNFVKEPALELLNAANIYAPDSIVDHTKYDTLANKLFKVIDVTQPPKGYWAAAQIFLLQLEEVQSKEKMFFVYDMLNEQNFPFIAMSYYNRLKDEQVGESYLFANRYIRDQKDVTTGRPIPLVRGEAWKCTNVTLNGNDYQLSLLLQNGRKNTILVPVEYAINEAKAYKQTDADQYAKRFAEAEWDKILNGEIEIGFTPEMVELSWGKPNQISRSSEGDTWKYKNTMIHFKDGKLASYY